MNNLILEWPENSQCISCVFSIPLAPVLDINIVYPAVVCKQDVTKNTYSDPCGYYKDVETEILTNQEIDNLNQITDELIIPTTSIQHNT